MWVEQDKKKHLYLYEQSFLQLREEIIENFDDIENMPFCELNWKKLGQWKWNKDITDDQAQTLTPRVCVLIVNELSWDIHCRMKIALNTFFL